MNKSQLKTGCVADTYLNVKELQRWFAGCMGCVLVFIGALFSDDASAYVLMPANVVDGYSNFSYSETDAVATFKVTIAFNQVYGNMGAYTYFGRGIVVFAYYGNGVAQSGSVVSTVTMDGVRAAASTSMYNYVLYQNRTASAGFWMFDGAQTVDVMITVLKSKIASWPAVSVLAANATTTDTLGDVSGAAYIGPSTAGGNCTVVVDPEIPPCRKPKNNHDRAGLGFRRIAKGQRNNSGLACN